jgi:hypothetical protein
MTDFGKSEIRPQNHNFIQIGTHGAGWEEYELRQCCL